MKLKNLETLMIAYGNALLDLPEYIRRYKENPASHWVSTACSEQLELVHAYAESIKFIAKELAMKNKSSNYETNNTGSKQA